MQRVTATSHGTVRGPSCSSSHPSFHWFLPTGGDDRHLGARSHGAGIGARPGEPGDPGAGASSSVGHRAPSLAYLTQIVTAAEELGFTGVLTPAGAHCEDAWLVTSALISVTRRLRFLVAFRPGLVSPLLAAQMAGTFQHLSAGRLMLNVVTGGDSAEQRAYGDRLDHDERYARAEEFLEVVHKAWAGTRFDHLGTYYHHEAAQLRRPPDPLPPVYVGGSSPPAGALSARFADVYLTWGEPVAQVAQKVAWVKALAAPRTVRFGLRIHVVARPGAAQAWEAAEQLISDLDGDQVEAAQLRLRRLDSDGQRRMLDLHGGDRARLVVAPNLWAGIGLVRGGAGTALVGSYDEVARRLEEYCDAGIDEFVLSGYPHLEEAYHVGEGVLPRVARR